MSYSILFTIFILSCFIGYLAIKNVSSALHSPLISVSNAISGIIIIGAIIPASQDIWTTNKFFAIIAIFLAAINIFGGFAISHRMLAMFKNKKKTKQ